MASQDFLQMRHLAAEEKMIQVVDDGPVVLRIKHVGTGSTQAPTVVLSSTASLITLTDAASDAKTVDLSASAYNTVGEVCDYINGLASWECKVLDALRSDASDNVFIDGSVTAGVAEGETVFDIKSDTGNLTAYRLRITYDRSVGGLKPKGGHRIILKEWTYNIDHTAAAGVAKMYEVTDNGKTETKIWSGPLSVDATATTYDFGDGITPGEGNDIVIAFDGTVVNAAGNFIQAQYKRE
jgi:hypothetical protein